MRQFRYVLFLLALCLLVPSAQGKDLRRKFGVGLDSQLSLSPDGAAGPTSFSVKYTFPASDKTVNIQLELLLGLSVIELKPASLVGGGRFLYTVIAEDNCNVFVGVGGAYLRGTGFEAPEGAIRIQPIGGVEFFLFGLENLGFTASLGLNVDLGDSVSVSTTAATVGNLGVHYYF